MENVLTDNAKSNTSLENMEFYVMFEDEVVSYIKVTDNRLIEAQKFDETNFKQPFLVKKITLPYIINFLKRRTVQKDKVDIDDILDGLGLDEYDAFKILRKTHGTSFDDFTWIKFSDENVNWDDVRVRGKF